MLLVGCATPETTGKAQMQVITGKGKGLWGDQITQRPPSSEEVHAFKQFAEKNGEMPVIRAIEALARMEEMRLEFDPALWSGKQFVFGSEVIDAPSMANTTVRLTDLSGLGVRQAMVAIANAYGLRIYQMVPSNSWQVTYEQSRPAETWRGLYAGWLELRARQGK